MPRKISLDECCLNVRKALARAGVDPDELEVCTPEESEAAREAVLKREIEYEYTPEQRRKYKLDELLPIDISSYLPKAQNALR